MFMLKISEAMKSSEDFFIKEIVKIDEYVICGYEQG
jgi:hypothetical protein